MSPEIQRRRSGPPRLDAVPAPARRLRAWISSFELALDISAAHGRHIHLLPADPRLPTDAAKTVVSSAAAARRLLDAAMRLPMALAQAQVAGPADHVARCFDEALAGLAEMETYLAMCRRLQWLDPATLGDLHARCSRLQRDLIGLAAEARDAALQRLQLSHTRDPDATITS